MTAHRCGQAIVLRETGVTGDRHEYGLIETPDLALCHLHSRLESSRTANVFLSWWGSLHKVIVQCGDERAGSKC